MSKFIYSFGNGQAEGMISDVALLGNKGVRLAEMTRIGLPVPPGFTISTEACQAYFKAGNVLSKDLELEIQQAIVHLNETVASSTSMKKACFGDNTNPLLVSIRSGAPVSMPGMMDTLLNVSLNNKAIQGLASHFNNRQFAYKTYLALIQKYGEIILGISTEIFITEGRFFLECAGVSTIDELSLEQLKRLAAKYRSVICTYSHHKFLQDPHKQMLAAIKAIFNSWNSPRAKIYREANNIPHDGGTAATVQAMVYGNLDNMSATGVVFTRSPSTGKPGLYGECLVKAQV